MSNNILASAQQTVNMIAFGFSVLLFRIITYSTLYPSQQELRTDRFSDIRFASTDPSGGEKPWDGVRAPRVISQLRFNTIHNPEAIIGM